MDVNLEFQKVLKLLSSFWEVEGSLVMSICILDGLKKAGMETISYFYPIV